MLPGAEYISPSRRTAKKGKRQGGREDRAVFVFRSRSPSFLDNSEFPRNFASARNVRLCLQTGQFT